jgi:hypothetical protein
MAAWERSRRASQEAAFHGVRPLGKGTTLSIEVSLVADRFLTR